MYRPNVFAREVTRFHRFHEPQQTMSFVDCMTTSIPTELRVSLAAGVSFSSRYPTVSWHAVRLAYHTKYGKTGTFITPLFCTHTTLHLHPPPVLSRRANQQRMIYPHGPNHVETSSASEATTIRVKKPWRLRTENELSHWVSPWPPNEPCERG